MAFDFPTSPAVGTVSNGYTWDGQKWVSVGTGAAIIAATPPAGAVNGDLWWDSDDGKLYIYYNDGTSSQWVGVGGASGGSSASGALAFSGMQLNGAMEVSQESGTASQSGTNIAKYVVDGWQLLSFGSQAVLGLQIATQYTPYGCGNAIQVYASTFNTSPGASDYCAYLQSIEGYRVSRLRWGTPNAQPITLGFFAHSTITGVFSGVVGNGAAPFRSYPFSYSITTANTWEYKTITIPGDVTGTWAKTNTVGMTLHFTAMAGSGVVAPAGAWTAGGFIGATGTSNLVKAGDSLLITGVSVLPGMQSLTATQYPLIMRSFDQELVTCQRYYQKIAASGTGLGGGAFIDMSLAWREMRVTPTMIQDGVFTFTSMAANFVQSAVSVATLGITPRGGGVRFGNFTGLALGTPYAIRDPNMLSLDARL